MPRQSRIEDILPGAVFRNTTSVRNCPLECCSNMTILSMPESERVRVRYDVGGRETDWSVSELTNYYVLLSPGGRLARKKTGFGKFFLRCEEIIGDVPIPVEGAEKPVRRRKAKVAPQPPEEVETPVAPFPAPGTGEWIRTVA